MASLPGSRNSHRCKYRWEHHATADENKTSAGPCPRKLALTNSFLLDIQYSSQFPPKTLLTLISPSQLWCRTKGIAGSSHWTTLWHWLKDLDSQVLLSHPHSPLKTWFLFGNQWVLCCLKHPMADAFSTGECLCPALALSPETKGKECALEVVTWDLKF